jgi:hypothetical protein
MSAFLSFSQMMRPSIRQQQPHLKNTEISSVLAERWRCATDEERRPHLIKEVTDREKYHNEMVKWREEESARAETSQQLRAFEVEDSGDYASLLGIEGLEALEDLETDVENLIYESGGQSVHDSSTSESSRSRSQRSSSTRSEALDSEQARSQSSYGARYITNRSSISNGDFTPLQEFSSRYPVDPVGSFVQVPGSMGKPTPGSRPAGTERLSSRPITAHETKSDTHAQRRPSLSYWSDVSSQSVSFAQPQSVSEAANADRLMDQAFGNEVPIFLGKSSSVLPSASPSVGSINNINNTLFAVQRADMFRSLNGYPQLQIPSDMIPLWANEASLVPMEINVDNTQKKNNIHPGNSNVMAATMNHVLAPERRTQEDQWARRSELISRQLHEQAEQASRQAHELELLTEQEDIENYRGVSGGAVSLSSSPSEDGDSGSPLEK